MKDLLSKNFFLISIAAVIAAILRWQIDKIWIVNIIGCFLLGFVNAMTISKKYKLIFGFGFCGSLTTFSGWSLELLELINKGFFKLLIFNLILTLLIGFSAVCLGHLFAKKIKA